MRRPTREPDATITRSASDAASAEEQGVRALVDGALSVASSRELFTRGEALSILHEVESAAHELSAGPRVEEIVHEADRESADRMMCSSADLVNSLLDIRLVLQKAWSAHSVPSK